MKISMHMLQGNHSQITLLMASVISFKNTFKNDDNNLGGDLIWYQCYFITLGPLFLSIFFFFFLVFKNFSVQLILVEVISTFPGTCTFQSKLGRNIHNMKGNIKQLTNRCAVHLLTESLKQYTKFTRK